MNNIKTLANKYFDEYTSIRRTIHQNPETGYKEFKTSKIIKDTLDSLNIEYYECFNTGVVGLIKGKNEGKTVLLRADMDALEVDEKADVEYKSKVKRLMHACGHDGHVAGLLGTAMILNELKDTFDGNIKLMFQPGEEKEGGALQMIEEGILENPKVDAAFGVHLWGPIPKGKVYVKEGATMAAPDQFKMKIIGKGGHSAMPQYCIDPVVIAANTISEVQTIVSRKINPLQPLVISTCTIHGGDAFNVIPQEVTLEGTVRSFDKEVRKEVPILMENILKGQAISNNSDYELDYINIYPAVINDKEMTELARKSLGKIIGKENVEDLPEPNMGGEDFAYLCERVPSSFIFVGIAEENKPAPVHHHPEFQWNDDALKISSASLAQIAIDFLSRGKEDVND
ncbi:M20 metallopeptidase family protein [Mycoplasma sp. P36-A1]|uniref:M20 metallopeptidase family protein n=1 Tax=Mycoplasma sp. P36-A1 TaxID=3252900 RepID=UPI003C2FC8CA